MAKTTLLEVYKDKKGLFKFRLLSKTGDTIVTSEGYEKKSSAVAHAKKIKDWVATALLVDMDGKAEVSKKTTASVSPKKTAKKTSTKNTEVKATV